MFRYSSLLLLCLSLGVHTMAQDLKQGPNPKATQKPATGIDYKQEGAPMPPLVLVAYHDTAFADTTGTAKEHKKNKKQKKEKMAAAPQGHIEKSVLTEKDLDNGANLIVMMFNPTCSHCEDVTDRIRYNIDLFKRSKVVLMASPVMKPYVPDFATRHHIAEYPQLYLGFDSSGFIDNVFLYQSLPQINIYNAERKLLKTYAGEVPIDTLKRFIQ